MAVRVQRRGAIPVGGRMRHDGDDESLRLLRCGVAVSSFYSESDSKVESTKQKSGASGQRQCTIRQFGERFPPDSTVRLVDGRSVGRLQVAYATAMLCATATAMRAIGLPSRLFDQA